MNIRPFLLGGVLASSSGLALLWAATSHTAVAEPPFPSASMAAKPAVSASAALPSASASAPAAVSSAPLPLDELPLLSEQTVPGERSDLPKQNEWNQSQLVEVSRRGRAGRACDVRLLREYLKVSCSFPMAGLKQFSGGTKDVELWIAPKVGRDNLFSPPSGGYAVIPLRRGEGHVIKFFSIESGYEDVGIGDSILVDAYWAPSAKAPTVVIRDP